jgi:hypothetical protein
MQQSRNFNKLPFNILYGLKDHFKTKNIQGSVDNFNSLL